MKYPRPLDKVIGPFLVSANLPKPSKKIKYVRECLHRSTVSGRCHFPDEVEARRRRPVCDYHHHSLITVCEKLFGQQDLNKAKPT